MCNCNPDTVNIQEYQRAVPIVVPDFIELYYNTPDKRKREVVCIDACLVSEIWDLWRDGIITNGCCCGHNKTFAYIGVNDEFINTMLGKGYEQIEGRNNEFVPKSLTQPND